MNLKHFQLKTIDLPTESTPDGIIFHEKSYTHYGGIFVLTLSLV